MGGRGGSSISGGGRGPGYSRGSALAKRVYAQHSGDLNQAEAVMNQRYNELGNTINQWQSGRGGVSTARAQAAMDEQNAIRDEMWQRGGAMPRR